MCGKSPSKNRETAGLRPRCLSVCTTGSKCVVAQVLCRLGWAILLAFVGLNLVAQGQEERPGFLVPVDLPLIGERAEKVEQQIRKIAESQSSGGQRPVVVLRFQASPLAELKGEPDNGGMGTRGIQFGRCADLARFLTSPDAARVRLIAYVPDDVEGHGVLPIIACEELYMSPQAALGRATIDEPLDAFIEPVYREVVQRRGTLPEPVVLSMLDTDREVYRVTQADGSEAIVGRKRKDALEEEGTLLKEKSIWSGGSLALYSGVELRTQGWIAPNVTSESELTKRLGLSGSLRTVRQLPREWKPVLIKLVGQIDQTRVNQIIRSLTTEIDEHEINLVVLQVSQTECDFSRASRLAGFLADLKEEVYTLALVQESLMGPSCLVPLSCRECVLIGDSTLGPKPTLPVEVDEAVQKFLGFLENKTRRPQALMSIPLNSDVKVQEYIHQENGDREIFADWQIAARPDLRQWEIRRNVAGGGAIEQQVALQYRLVDSLAESDTVALSRLGLEELPEELSTPWIDATIQMLLSQGWLPRLLLTIGFFALMAELGNPGIGAGAFLSGLCFLGFFWVEGFNGNVEMLEIMLFVAGLVALALEIFVVPGFGVFGIGGLLMLFVSVVLASQTFVWPTTSAELGEVASNLFWTACMALAGIVGLLFMHRHVENFPMFRWMKLNPDDSEDLDYRESLAHRDHLLGETGLTVTRLNPAGKAQFGREIVSVVGAGRLIAEGVPVKVVEVRGNVIIVEES